MRRRENTFRVDYANVPRKPTFVEVHQFLSSILGLKREQVERMQCSKSLGCAFVKVNDLATAQSVVEMHGEQHEVVVDDKSYPIRITMEDGAVDVKVTDLSEDVTDEAVIEFMERYGEVISIHEQLWGENYAFEGIPTGVRIVRMLVRTNIPSFVVIDSETTAVSYFGQRQTCRHCEDFVHNGVSCVVNKKLLVQKLAADGGKVSYADVMKPTKPNKPTKPTGTSKLSETVKPKRMVNSMVLPKKLGPATKPAGAKAKDPQQSKQLSFQPRNTNTNESSTTNTTMPPPPDPQAPIETVDVEQANDDGSESDGSSKSSSSKSSRGGRQPNKKQKTGHEANSSLA